MDEFNLIHKYFAGPIDFRHENVVLGPGDDCAIVSLAADEVLCVSTDTLIEGVHFPPGMPGQVAAHRVMAANLSDLAAMGAKPHSFTLAITLPEQDEVWLGDFSKCLNQMVRQYQIPLVGGNIAKGPLSITINIMGTTKVGKAMLRSGAKLGDKIYVTSNLGSAAAGLKMFWAADSKFDGCQNSQQQGLWDSYFEPTPRIDCGLALVDLATACIDISDGFAADLAHICAASQVGCNVWVENLPIAKEVVDAFGRDVATDLALSGGDDYELCFTANSSVADELQVIAGRLQIAITEVGEVTLSDISFVDGAGNSVIPPAGYQHF